MLAIMSHKTSIEAYMEELPGNSVFTHTSLKCTECKNVNFPKALIQDFTHDELTVGSTNIVRCGL